jgi:hypothetical protein
MPVVPALRKWRQEDREFKASLGYITRPCPKIQQKEKGRKREPRNRPLGDSRRTS